jgi:hypothetical protein
LQNKIKKNQNIEIQISKRSNCYTCVHETLLFTDLCWHTVLYKVIGFFFQFESKRVYDSLNRHYYIELRTLYKVKNNYIHTKQYDQTLSLLQ